MSIDQPTVILKAVTTADTDVGGTIVFPYQPPLTQADLAATQTVYIEVYGRVFDGLVVTVGADSADVTWPADAPYPLPAGEYNVSFLTSEPAGLPEDSGQAAAVAPVVLVAQAVDPATIDLPGLATAYNTAVAAHDELATQFNALLLSLQAANLMAPAAPVALSAKTKAKK
jgi:hypothetical protein